MMDVIFKNYCISYDIFMIIKKILKIDKISIHKLQKMCRVQTLEKPTSLFYQGHIPIVAFLVIEGGINLYKNKKLKSTIVPGEIIGLKELTTDTPSKVAAESLEHTTICCLDKSTIKEILESGDERLSTYMSSAC